VRGQHILTGDAREYLVMAYLTLLGFEVSRMSGKASYDLAAYKNGKVYRIEVKGKADGPRGTGPVGSLSPRCNLRANEFDIVITVFDEAVTRSGINCAFLTGNFRCNRSLLCTSDAVTRELCGDDITSKHTTHRNLKRAAALTAKEAE
jgi:hypothetical protein